MAWTTRGLMLAAAAGGTAVIAWRFLRSRTPAGWPTPDEGGRDRWHVVTVALPINEVAPAAATGRTRRRGRSPDPAGARRQGHRDRGPVAERPRGCQGGAPGDTGDQVDARNR
jgi:hypothetical protein